ncbi:unnamed protein product [Phytophthora fragariaefolia]|uniref:Unnamed protein product n=1 Tax=Phytophthora fragariaefolia TaxID=1490495 RepID=A0A9W7CWV6_9STRA|nr:unnamed protein product [Phytophthora fragariaefolia]
MDEEDEFGMSKTSRDADPMEQEDKSAVKDHPDFNFLDAEQLRTDMASEVKRAVPLWMTKLPVEKDPSQWTILEVQIRPDRAWEVIKELIATVCIGKGLVVAEEHANSVLFRKKVTQESVAHGMANTATFLNVFVHIGVSPSKLRVVDICTLVSDENKLLGGMMSTGRSSLWAAQGHNQPHNVQQVRFAFFPCQEVDADRSLGCPPSEMKATMRDLCIPLESYAYDQEFACAMLIGLLEPSLKKYGIKLAGASSSDEVSEGNSGVALDSVEAFSKRNDSALKEKKAPSPHVPEPIDASPSTDKTAPSEEPGKIYGEVISELVQTLWRKSEITSNLYSPKGQCATLRGFMHGKRYSCHTSRHLWVSITLKVSWARIDETIFDICRIYSNLIYRTMMPVFARTTVVSFEDVVNVSQTTSFGIQVVSVELDSAKHAKGMTIAMGLEVDLLYQLLHEINASLAALPPLQQQETEKNPTELKKILGSEEEETKEDEDSPVLESASASDDTSVANSQSD